MALNPPAESGTTTRVSRDATADLLKGVAVLLMIQVHILEQFATSDLYDSFLGKISLFLGGPACAPIFMAIMGFYLSRSHKSLKAFMVRGCVLFIGGIALNTVRSAHLLILVLTDRSDADPWRYIFGADILPLAGLSIVIIGFLRLVWRKNFLPWLLLSFLVVLPSPWLTEHFQPTGLSIYILSFITGGSAWSYFPLFPWLAYVLLGYAFGNFICHNTWYIKAGKQKELLIVISALVVFAAGFPWALKITIDLEGALGYYHHGFLYFLWVLCFILAYTALTNRIPEEQLEKPVARFIRWMGVNVTFLYVIQWLIIGNLAPAIYKTQNLFQSIGWLVVVTSITALAGRAFIHLKT